MMKPPGLFGSGSRLGMHRVVVILGVGRIDGDERQLAPVLAAVQASRAWRLPPRAARRQENMRDRVGVDGDQADRALGLRASRAARSTRAGRRGRSRAARRQLDRDQIAVLARPASAPAGSRVRGRAASCRPASSRPPPSGSCAEDAEHAVLGVIDELDDAAACGGLLVVVAGCPRSAAATRSPTPATSSGPRPARDVDADFRRRAVLGLVPFGRGGDQFAVAVAAGDVGDHASGQRAGLVQLLARASRRGLRRRVRAASCFSSARSAFFRSKSRAISRVPTLPGCSPMKATMSSLEGRGICCDDVCMIHATGVASP